MESITVLLERPPKPHHLPFVLARESDLYAERGLDVTLRSPGASDGSLELLLEGDVQYALTRPSNLVAKFLDDQSLVGISRMFRSHSGVLYRSDRLDAPADLTGETSLLCNGVDDWLARRLVDRLWARSGEETGSFDADDLPVEVTDRDPAEAFLEEDFDLLVPASVNPEGIQFEQGEAEVDFWFFDDHGIPADDDLVVVTTSERADNKPNDVQNFVHATHDAVKEIDADTDAARELLRETHPEIVEQPGVSALLFTSLSELTTDFSQDFQAYTAWGEFLTEETDLEGFVDIDQLTDERFIPLESVSF